MPSWIDTEVAVLDYQDKKTLETKERALRVLKMYEDEQRQEIVGSGVWAALGLVGIALGVAIRKSEPGLSRWMYAMAALFLLYAVLKALYRLNNKSEAKELEKTIV